jgi:hypothetical protein
MGDFDGSCRMCGSSTGGQGSGLVEVPGRSGGRLLISWLFWLLKPRLWQAEKKEEEAHSRILVKYRLRCEIVFGEPLGVVLASWH